MNSKNILNKTSRTLLLRNYSPETRKSYLLYIKKYIIFLEHNTVNERNKDIENFLIEKIKKGQSPQTINLALNAIKFLYREILKDNDPINIKFAKRDKKLPVILSKTEIEKIISATTNPKYRIMIAISYGSGLRVSEVVNLKVSDLDIEELTIHIKKSKNKKDRITIIPKLLKTDLQNLMAGKRKNDYLFISNRGTKLTTTSLQKMFRKSLKEGNIKKPATFHSLRHSFATHLLENGVSIRYIQELLGHSSIRTTQVYTKVTKTNLRNIKSPLS